MGDWKLIKYDVMEGKVRETQLFDLRQNPLEFLPEHHLPANTQTKVVVRSANRTSQHPR